MSETLFERATRLGLADANLSDVLDRIETLEQKIKNLEYATKMRDDHRVELERQNGELLRKLLESGEAVERFRVYWRAVPYFANRVSKATRESISAALSHIVNFDAVGGPLHRPTTADAAIGGKTE